MLAKFMPASQTLVLPPLIHGFQNPSSQCMCDCLWEDPRGSNKNSFDADLKWRPSSVVWCGGQWIIMVSEPKLSNCIQSLGIGLDCAIYTGLNKVFVSQCHRFF